LSKFELEAFNAYKKMCANVFLIFWNGYSQNLIGTYCIKFANSLTERKVSAFSPVGTSLSIYNISYYYEIFILVYLNVIYLTI